MFNRISLYIFFILFILYSLVNAVLTEGSVFARGCFVMTILLSAIYLIKSLLTGKAVGIFFISWTILLALNCAGFILNPSFTEGTQRLMFVDILAGLLPFYPFWYFSMKGIVRPSELVALMIIMIPVAILQFYSNQSSFMTDYDITRAEVVNNSAYTFVALIPFVFLIKEKRILSMGIITLLLFFIIKSAKRGAIITAFIGLSVYFGHLIILMKRERRYGGIVISLMMLFAILFYAYASVSDNDFLLERLNMMMEGDTSARSFVYSSILNKWAGSNSLLSFFTGFGFGSSVGIAGGMAHNDWLELLSSFGLIGVICYLVLYLSAVDCCFKRYWSTPRRMTMTAIVLMWFVTSMISMWYNSGSYMTAAMLGWLVGQPADIYIDRENESVVYY